MNEITTPTPAAQVILPDIRDIKAETRQDAPRIDRLKYMADLLDQLPNDGRFNLREWETCICAWTIHAAGQTHRPLADINPIHVAREWLRLPLAEATQLFNPEMEVYGDVSAKQAAKVIRHYIDTNTVDWQVAALEGVPRLAQN